MDVAAKKLVVSSIPTPSQSPFFAVIFTCQREEHSGDGFSCFQGPIVIPWRPLATSGDLGDINEPAGRGFDLFDRSAGAVCRKSHGPLQQKRTLQLLHT